ncbi:hypothetical protein GCM10009650_20240 [Nesterenkonia jeotgali]
MGIELSWRPIDGEHGLEYPIPANGTEVGDPQLGLVRVKDRTVGVFGVDPYGDGGHRVITKVLSHDYSLAAVRRTGCEGAGRTK